MNREYEDRNYYEELRLRVEKEEKRKKETYINYHCYLCGAHNSNFFHYENGNIIVKCLDCVKKENNKRLEKMRYDRN